MEVPCVSVRCNTMFRLEQEDQGIRRLSPNAVQTRGLPASCAQRYEVHILHVPGCSSTRERLIVPGFCFLHYRSPLHTYTSNEKRIRERKRFPCCLPPFSLSHHPPTSSPDIFSQSSVASTPIKWINNEPIWRKATRQCCSIVLCDGPYCTCPTSCCIR